MRNELTLVGWIVMRKYIYLGLRALFLNKFKKTNREIFGDIFIYERVNLYTVYDIYLFIYRMYL